jgi:hypothetical protein
VASFKPITEDLGLMGLWVDEDSHAATTYGDCAYSKKDVSRPPAESAFLPGCPTGDGFEFKNVSDDPGNQSITVLSSARFGDNVGLGGWYSSGGEVTYSGAVAMWVDFL